MRFINPLEAIKRLAAAQGIDVLNLVKTEEQLAEQKEEQMQNQQNQTLLEQAGQFANSKLADSEYMQGMQPPQEQPDYWQKHYRMIILLKQSFFPKRNRTLLK